MKIPGDKGLRIHKVFIRDDGVTLIHWRDPTAPTCGPSDDHVGTAVMLCHTLERAVRIVQRGMEDADDDYEGLAPAELVDLAELSYFRIQPCHDVRCIEPHTILNAMRCKGTPDKTYLRSLLWSMLESDAGYRDNAYEHPVYRFIEILGDYGQWDHI